MQQNRNQPVRDERLLSRNYTLTLPRWLGTTLDLYADEHGMTRSQATTLALRQFLDAEPPDPDGPPPAQDTLCEAADRVLAAIPVLPAGVTPTEDNTATSFGLMAGLRCREGTIRRCLQDLCARGVVGRAKLSDPDGIKRGRPKYGYYRPDLVGRFGRLPDGPGAHRRPPAGRRDGRASGSHP